MKQRGYGPLLSYLLIYGRPLGKFPGKFPFYRHKTAMTVGRSPRIAALAGDEELIADTRKRSTGKSFPALHGIDAP